MGEAPWTTIPALVDDAAQRFPDTEALADGDVRWAFPELVAQIHAASRALIASGVAPGDRIAIWAPNVREWVVAALAVHSCGAVLVPVNTRFKAAETTYVLEKARVSRLFTVTDFLDVDYVAMLGDADPVTCLEEIVVLRGRPSGDALAWADFLARGGAVDDGARAARAAAVEGRDACHVLFTSGTTGAPKGVVLEHAQVCAVYHALAGVFGMEHGDRQLVVLPFFHSFGLHVGILAAFMVGATILPHLVFEADAVMRRIADDRVTSFPGPPSVFQAMLASPLARELDLSSLKKITIGAAGFPPRLVEDLHERFGVERVQSGYGLTESSGTVALCSPPDTPEMIANTVGRPIPGVELRIVDDEGHQLPQGQPGEVLVRGYTVMRGYLDDPEQTAAAIDPEGWLHTGDVGLLREDGNLVITDRKKDMYSVGGFNAYPAEIERIMAQHPQVGQVAVIGVPDERLGEVGMAFVIPRPGEEPDPEELVAWAREHMANYKAPRHVEVVTELPLNATGKVLKGVLREQAARVLAR
jgi:acyl-CoA synthetase (AMP-forming)/AMP-acid ligase II